MVSLTVIVGLPTLVNLISKLPHGHAQGLVSMVILNPVKLTITFLLLSDQGNL